MRRDVNHHPIKRSPFTRITLLKMRPLTRMSSCYDKWYPISHKIMCTVTEVAESQRSLDLTKSGYPFIKQLRITDSMSKCHLSRKPLDFKLTIDDTFSQLAISLLTGEDEQRLWQALLANITWIIFSSIRTTIMK